MNIREIFKIIISIFIAQLAGLVGNVFTVGSLSTWYPSIKKPFFNPPNSVFGPVWITLFSLMGIASYLIWRKGIDKPKVKTALMIYGAQLVLNALWSILFFGLRSPIAAFFEIIILFLAILATIISFYAISIPAALLLVPYMIWVGFASVLNYFIWQLNR